MSGADKKVRCSTVYFNRVKGVVERGTGDSAATATAGEQKKKKIKNNVTIVNTKRPADPRASSSPSSRPNDV